MIGPNQAGCAPLLGERYVFEDLEFDVTLSELDFNPDNPASAFTQF